jgi:hypothetical protein
MGAVLLTLALVVVWGAAGYAVLRLLRPGPALPNLLLAPAVGVAVTVVPVFLLSRAGIPVGRFALWSLIPLLGAGLVALWQGRRSTPWRRYAPFAGILLAALFLTGRPMLEYDFDWLSYCNEDMGNYCLRAQRLQAHGWAELPPEQDLLDGRDYSQFYFFMDVPGMTRVGADLLLAWTASLTGLTAHQAFMPVILAFHLTLISSAGGLVCPSDDGRARALWTCGLLALSALTTLGALYQLIAQVSGLALLAACLAVLCRPTAGVSVWGALRHGALGGVLTAALMFVYPEVLPFLGVAVVLYLAIGLARRTTAVRPLLAGGGCALATIGVLLNSYLIAVYFWLSGQASHGAAHKEMLAQIFPYYLVPTGLAQLWGFLAISGRPPPEPWLTASVVLGGGVLAASAAFAAVRAWRGDAAAIMTALMLAVAVALFRMPDGFGLFKLAMFVQPFLLGTLAAWQGVARRRVARLAVLAALALAGLGSQARYVDVSRGHVLASMAEIPDASASRINTEFRRAVAAVPAKALVLDSTSTSLLHFQVVYTRGVPTALPNYYLFVPGRTTDLLQRAGCLGADVANYTGRVVDDFGHEYDNYSFRLFDDNDRTGCAGFALPRTGRHGAGADGTYLVESGPRLSILNRRRFAPDDRRYFVSAHWADVTNYLLYTASERGQHHAVPMESYPEHPVGLYQLEPDGGFAGRTCSACGRHVLFEVVHPTPGPRLMLSLTTTFMGDGQNRLPPAAAVGAGRVPFPLVGRGSARVFAPPLAPQMLGGRPFLAVDLGAEPRRFRYRPTGAMRWYGAKLVPDPRKVVAFARDVSLASDEEYAALRPASRLTRFPEDLENPDLEYSGMYEDGWCSEAFFCRLTRPGRAAEAVVRGLVPQIDDPSFTTEATVLIDGQEAARRTLTLGEFEIRAPVPLAPSGLASGETGGGEGCGDVRRIDLRFSRFQRLPGDDKRPVGAQLSFVGFEAAAAGGAP